VGIFSHFARADEVGQQQNRDQLNVFKARIAELAAIGINPPIIRT
jgi:alanine racemase